VRLTVLGGSGAWPTARQACSGYLIERDGFRLLVDPGYSTLPALLGRVAPEDVDAVLVTHGHPDHCTDVHPLLRARVMRGRRPPPLPLHAPAGSLAKVLALDPPGPVDEAYELHDLAAGEQVTVGPFTVDATLLPHTLPNLGVRLAAGGATLGYTGDTGPSPDVAELARGTDLFLAAATFAEQVPEPLAPYLCSARAIGEYAAAAEPARTILTHLSPGTDPDDALTAARSAYGGEIAVAGAGLVVDIGGTRS
jgi:ribonuclease BN (tRNA processing enzyme)